MINRPSGGNATQRGESVQNAHESIIAAQVKTKVWLELGGEFFAGDGGIHLLGGIPRHGSLAQTVREIGWSYRHAWGDLRRGERALAPRIACERAAPGGRGGRSSGGPSARSGRRSCATAPDAAPRAAWS